MAAQYKKIEGGSTDEPVAAKNYYQKEEHLEIDLYQRDADLTHRQITCIKNPGHEQFVPVAELSMEDLPTALRHQPLLDYVAALGKLIVRVRVNHTSQARSKDDPFQSLIGREVYRGATGCVEWVSEGKDVKEIPCKDKNCLQGCEHSVYGFVEIRTNRHVIYNAEEARRTEVDFFFDSTNRMSVVTMKGHDVKQCSEGDHTVILRCVTHDVDFLGKMARYVDLARLAGASMWLDEELRRSLLDYAVILSHPHGQMKSFSVGALSDYRKIPDNAGLMKRLFRQIKGKMPMRLRVTTYTAATCSGCTGAPVITGYEEGWKWWCLSHSTADLNAGINMAFH